MQTFLAEGINLRSKSKDFGNQRICNVLGECELWLTSNLSLSDLIEEKIIDEEKKTISFLIWQQVGKNIAKNNPKVFLLIRLLRNSILLY